MSFVRKSISLRAGVGTEITSAKILDDYYGFNRLLELKQGALGDSLWDAGDSHVLSEKKFGKTGGVTGTGTLGGGEYLLLQTGAVSGRLAVIRMTLLTTYYKIFAVKCVHKTGTVNLLWQMLIEGQTGYYRVTEDDVVVVAETSFTNTSYADFSASFSSSKNFSEVALELKCSAFTPDAYLQRHSTKVNIISFPA